MSFHIIASTGRTATTYIAATLDALDGVAACHEGYRGSDKDSEPLMPLINLENARAYQIRSSVADVVAKKRSPKIVAEALAVAGENHLVDVAYYNPTIAEGLLEAHGEARMIGIIRKCEDFVRSATTLEGEDPLPVGWPEPTKPMSSREQFIALGRIKPRRGTDEAASWKGWSAIMRNIWLWRETNLMLAEAKNRFGDRVKMLSFSTFKEEPQAFWDTLTDHFRLPKIVAEMREGKEIFTNKKAFGYQIGAAPSWTEEEQQFLIASVEQVEKILGHVS